MRRTAWRFRSVIFVSLVLCAIGILRSTAQEQSPAASPAVSAPAAETTTNPAPSTASAPATSAPASQPASSQPAGPKLVPLAFKNAPMDQIAKFLSEHLGKPVISKGVEQKKVTLINTKKLPLPEALEILQTALQESGVTIEERDKTVHLIPIENVRQAQIPTVAPDALAEYTPANRIVRTVFELEHYDPSKLIKVLEPMMPSFGHLIGEPSGKLIAVDTVEHMILIASIIADLDRADARGGETRVFVIKHVDINEIIPILRHLIGGFLGQELKAVTVAGGAPAAGPSRGGRPGPSRPGRPSGGPSSNGTQAAATSVIVTADKTPVTLIPDPRRSAIIVLAPSAVLTKVEKWLEELDQPQPRIDQTEIVKVEYGDPDEVAQQLTTLLSMHPDEGLRNALRIVPFGMSRRLMIIGSPQNRKMVRDWIREIDVEDSGLRITVTFELEYADAQTISENILELFGESQSSSRYRSYFYYGGRPGQGSDRAKVTVTANVRRNSVTVVAASEKMARIRDQIKEWDKPLSGEQVVPRVFELKYIDPEETKIILENLFVKKESQDVPYWYFDQPEDTASPVGRLHGQFLFEAYPETGKLVVVSKNEENYRVIEDLLEQLDRPPSAGMPRIITLRFADAETLAEQLNALLNAPGTPTSILRRGHLGTFDETGDEGSPFAAQQQQQQPRQQQSQQNNQQVMTFWWQGVSQDTRNKQPSNMVGKIRIVPNVEQNLLLVAAPEEYAKAIEELVRQLDKPGYQVLIKAVIIEITHDDATSLGYRFSTDPSQFISGDPLITENALRGLFNYSFEDTVGQRHAFSFNLDVNNLISLLRRVTNLRIKSEPKILTADNIAAEFFDGQDIPFISNSRLLAIGTRDETFEYREVGIKLQVRPHITKERRVDLTINLEISSIVPGRTLFGGAIVDRRETTTRVILEDGHTFLISGILREVEREITRRIPGLGDIPLLGELFKHKETAIVNTETLVFLTPYVIGPDDPRDPIEAVPLERMRQQGLDRHPKPEVSSSDEAESSVSEELADARDGVDED